jgi:hypothetical protein
MKAPTPSQFAALRTAEIGHALGAGPLSSPAEFVVAEEQYDSAMRFSRSLDERHPYMRSSQALIVTEEGDPMPVGDLWVCIFGVLCIVAAVGWLL